MKVYGIYECENKYYIATEMIKGGELFNRIIN